MCTSAELNAEHVAVVSSSLEHGANHSVSLRLSQDRYDIAWKCFLGWIDGLSYENPSVIFL